MKLLMVKYSITPTVPVYKEFLKYMNKLYSEELTDQEYFSQTDDLRKAKQAQGLVACFTDHAAWLNIPDEDIWRQYGSIEPMTSEFNSKKSGLQKTLFYMVHLLLQTRLTILPRLKS